jgi:hypothetical protein
VGLAQRSQPAAELVVAVDQQRAELVGGLGAGLDGAAAGHHQGAQLPCGAVAVLGDGAGVAGQHGPGGGLGVDRVGLALAAPAGAVGAVDLDHADALGHQVLGQPVAVAAGALHPGGGDLAVVAGPGDQVAVGGVGGAKGRGGLVAAEPIQQDRDVDVLVGINPENELRRVGHR